MRRLFRGGALLSALLIVATGCASKDWVRDRLARKEAAVGERLGKRDAEFKQRFSKNAQRIERMGSELQMLQSTVGDVGEVAEGARGRADAAFARVDEVDSRLTRLWRNRDTRNLVNTLSVHFAFNRWDLDDAAQTALVSLIGELRENPNLTVDLEGYADSVGAYEYNVQLSQRRVESVRRYLVDKGVELPRIHSIGMGELPDNGTSGGRAKNRRVSVRLMVPME